jgi:hypothetical protein
MIEGSNTLYVRGEADVVHMHDILAIPLGGNTDITGN